MGIFCPGEPEAGDQMGLGPIASQPNSGVQNLKGIGLKSTTVQCNNMQRCSKHIELASELAGNPYPFF